MFEPSRKIAVTPPAGLGPTLGVAALVTALATALSYLLPDSWAATGVGFVFLFATYRLVIRNDDLNVIRDHGLALGGLLEPAPLSPRHLLSSTLRALGYALGAALVIYPFFWLGFRIWWKVGSFHPAPLGPLLADAPGQLLVIALPEEAFYRGYLQTALSESLHEDERGTITVFGARIGWSLVVSSAIFALGHLLTELNPGRLAVFFPSLVFGFLRARTRGIGSGVLFHALCNLYSAYLLKSYFGG
jgi:membrane protease YdiL (CAAX protease family)